MERTLRIKTFDAIVIKDAAIVRSKTSKIILDSMLNYISIVSECIISSMMA